MTDAMKKRVAALCIVCAVAGYLAHGWTVPDAKPNRPVLTWIARAARTALMFFFFAERPPEDANSVQHPMADGSVPVDHGRAI